MTVQTGKIGKREFAFLPKRDFERLAALARQTGSAAVTAADRQGAGDVAESRRRMKEPGGSTLAEMRKKLRR